MSSIVPVETQTYGENDIPLDQPPTSLGLVGTDHAITSGSAPYTAYADDNDWYSPDGKLGSSSVEITWYMATRFPATHVKAGATFSFRTAPMSPRPDINVTLDPYFVPWSRLVDGTLGDYPTYYAHFPDYEPVPGSEFGQASNQFPPPDATPEQQAQLVAWLEAGQLTFLVTGGKFGGVAYGGYIPNPFKISLCTIDTGVTPPLRKIQRSDGLAMGAPRRIQTSTVQSSNRRFGIR